MSSARYCKLDPATRTIQPDEHSPSEDTILDGPNQAVPPGPQDVDKANRQMALDLFDAFASTEKTLYANMGGHTGVPSFASEDAARFFARHLDSTGD